MQGSELNGSNAGNLWTVGEEGGRSAEERGAGRRSAKLAEVDGCRGGGRARGQEREGKRSSRLSVALVELGQRQRGAFHFIVSLDAYFN